MRDLVEDIVSTKKLVVNGKSFPPQQMGSAGQVLKVESTGTRLIYGGASLNSKGQIIVRGSGGTDVAVDIGSEGQVLKVNSGSDGLEYGTFDGLQIVSASHQVSSSNTNPTINLPAISVPAGIDKSGLPLGLQVVAKPFDEETMFRTANSLEQAANFTAKPKYVGGQ